MHYTQLTGGQRYQIAALKEVNTQQKDIGCERWYLQFSLCDGVNDACLEYASNTQ